MSKCSLSFGSVHLEPDFKIMPLNAQRHFPNKTNKTYREKKRFLGKTGLIFLTVLSVHLYSSLKYKFYEHFYKIGPVAFALAWGPHNNNNLENNKHSLQATVFINHLFGIWGPLNRYFRGKLYIDFFTIS